MVIKEKGLFRRFSVIFGPSEENALNRFPCVRVVSIRPRSDLRPGMREAVMEEEVKGDELCKRTKDWLAAMGYKSLSEVSKDILKMRRDAVSSS